MPEMKHSFQKGRMNKDLDERIVPDGEYREALNVEVMTSEGSDMGSLQTNMGNTLLSQIDPNGNENFICIGSIEDGKNNKLYWFITGNDADIIAEYDYVTGDIVPVCVDVHAGVNRVLKFDENFLITGLNIMDGVLYWTDNNSEPKKVNIKRFKAGTPPTVWTTTTLFYVLDLTPGAIPNSLIPALNPNGSPMQIKEEHVTIIKKGPPAAPVLEMIDTTHADGDLDTLVGGRELQSTVANASSIDFVQQTGSNAGEFEQFVIIQTPYGVDFLNGDYLIISDPNDTSVAIRVVVVNRINFGTFEVEILSGNVEIQGREDLTVKLEQTNALFQFKFPRFATRYKYEDGEYSAFSPFTEVAFIPGRFDYMPREGYNLGMVNRLRNLAIKDFVFTKSIPRDVIAIDILYKESNSTNVYSVKQIKRTIYDEFLWDEWNASSATTTSEYFTKGYLPITSELIHAALPANQLLRPWDNVPRKALAQEIIGNRLVYGNYLQNYNLKNQYASELQSNIRVSLNVKYDSKDLGDIYPEEIHAGLSRAKKYSPAKSIKSLRTYQAGIVYIDKFGRETPVLSDDTRGGDDLAKSSIYMPKDVANKRNQLSISLQNNPPEWATHFKYFIKETANEYYNMSMDRWYDAEDGNIWISFPSAERNKVDEETFLILKKEHDSDKFVSDPARYKILAIENEAPMFIKLRNIQMGGVRDGYTTGTTPLPIIGNNSFSTFPQEGGIQIYVETTTADGLGWNEQLISQDISSVYFRVKTGNGISNYYRLKQISLTGGYYVLTSATVFGTDMNITSIANTWATRVTNCEIQIVKKIPEERAEFEGRFFAKILKDYTLIERLGIHIGSIVDYVDTATMSVQYIHPNAPAWNEGASPWFGQNKNRISIDSKNNRWLTSQDTVGNGDEYWKFASRHDSGVTTGYGISTGWFIDASEGFVPFNDTALKFDQDSVSKRWDFQPDPTFYGNCLWGGFGKGDYRDDVADGFPKMQKALGLNNYDQSFSDLNYLSCGNVRPPVSTSSVSIVENNNDPTIGERASKNRGINGNFIFLSYSGLNDEAASSSSGNGNNDWTNFNGSFSDPVKHAADTMFIDKLLQPNTVFTWAEDPGEVLYITQDSSVDYPNDQLGLDGKRGIMMWNYINFADYWVTDSHWHRCEFACFGSYVCDSKKDGLVSRAKKPGYVSGGNYNGLVTDVYTGGICLCCTVTLDILCPERVETWVHASAMIVNNSGNANGQYGTHHVWPNGVHDWNASWNKRRRYVIKAVPLDNIGLPMIGTPIGGVGPHFYSPTNSPDFEAHFDVAYNPITAHPATGITFTDNAPGIRRDGMNTGHTWTQYNFLENAPIGATQPTTLPQYKRFDATTLAQSPAPGSVTWTIKELFAQDIEDNKFSSTNPAIWETEPKEDVGLNIYYEVGQIYPIELNDSTIEQHVGAVGPDIMKNSYVTCTKPLGGPLDLRANGSYDVRVISASDSGVVLGAMVGGSMFVLGASTGDVIPNSAGHKLTFHRADGSSTEATTDQAPTASFFLGLYSNVHNLTNKLSWFNCYSFGNGVESDRIRDDYNQVKIDNGPKASTTIEEPYLEERRCSGFIWSGIYNSNSGVNDLNQFIQAEAITKEVNPGYGCIQKMHTRDNDLVAFCEDRVLQVYANKDALYNADGDVNVVATNRVLGAVKPFLGDYGISKNPESFASDSYRSYFSDASRGAILRLSQNGITPISDAGMSDWFSDVLPKYAKIADHSIIGSFDDKKQEYNITLTTAEFLNSCGINPFPASGSSGGTVVQNIEDETNYTLSYSERAKGWTSFRSYIQESGVSLNNEYYTFKNGELYKHHSNNDRNFYYGVQYDSYVSVLLNQAPGIVKSFATLNYEGSKARITADLNNPDYYDNTSKDGWYVSEMTTDLQEAGNLEFISKEEKYFSQIRGIKTNWDSDGTAGNIDMRELSFQGIGSSTFVECPTCGPTVSWNCTGVPCKCDQVSGSQGQYPTLAACENDINGCCGEKPSWCCFNGNCIDPGDGTGPYTTLCDCVESSTCCDEGQTYLYECLGLPLPSVYIPGCMDDGTSTDPFITQNRPAGWIGPAANYDPLATVPDCSCVYQTLVTYDCNNGVCYDPGTGAGQYPTLAACVANCIDPCDNQNMAFQSILTNPTTLTQPCLTFANDGTVSVSVDNANSTAPIPFTSWTWELFNFTTQGGPIGSLIYSDPNVYATGVYSNTYTGLTLGNPTTTLGIYYVMITDNNGCEYGPFTIKIGCDSCVQTTQTGGPCASYPTNPLSSAGTAWSATAQFSYSASQVVLYNGFLYTLAPGFNTSTYGVWIPEEWSICCDPDIPVDPCDNWVYDECCEECTDPTLTPASPCWAYCQQWADCCPDPCDNYPGDNGCCNKCDMANGNPNNGNTGGPQMGIGHPCYNWCTEWQYCCPYTIGPCDNYPGDNGCCSECAAGAGSDPTHSCYAWCNLWETCCDPNVNINLGECSTDQDWLDMPWGDPLGGQNYPGYKFDYCDRCTGGGNYTVDNPWDVIGINWSLSTPGGHPYWPTNPPGSTGDSYCHCCPIHGIVSCGMMDSTNAMVSLTAAAYNWTWGVNNNFNILDGTLSIHYDLEYLDGSSAGNDPWTSGDDFYYQVVDSNGTILIPQTNLGFADFDTVWLPGQTQGPRGTILMYNLPTLAVSSWEFQLFHNTQSGQTNTCIIPNSVFV